MRPSFQIMKIFVTGKQLDIGDALRRHVRERLEAGVRKYFDHPLATNVTISREAHGFRADCSVQVGSGMMLQSHGEAGDAYASFDFAVEKLEKRLRRHKRRLKGHHSAKRADLPTTPAQSYVIAATDAAEDGASALDSAAESARPVVIAETTTVIPTVTAGEAVMRLDFAEAPALMFRNSAHGRLNMVYRRADGNIGWIDPVDSELAPVDAAMGERTAP